MLTMDPKRNIQCSVPREMIDFLHSLRQFDVAEKLHYVGQSHYRVSECTSLSSIQFIPS